MMTMSKVKEAKREFEELSTLFNNTYSTTNISLLSSEGIALLIKVLEAKLVYKELSEDMDRFHRYTKPVISMQISKAKGALRASRFLEAKI